jgi:DNA-binding transcriptional regulator of glucitol operon
MSTPLLLLGAVVAGWLVQLWLTYRQSMSFNDDVRRLRPSGTVSVGSGGRRYRGGRAFVALAFDERGVVADAIQLKGFTTFARSRRFTEVLGLKASQLRGQRDVPGLSPKQREAVRQAAELFRQRPGSTTTTTTTRDQPVAH